MKKAKENRYLYSGIAAVIAMSFMASGAQAGAFYLQEQSVKANGRAWSGEVSERGIQQLWWNPAAIGGIETREAFMGATGLLPKGKVTNVNTRVIRPTLAVGGSIIPSTNLPVGGVQVQEDPVESGVLPTGGFAIPLNDKITFGIVASSPFSFTTDYDPDNWARYLNDETYLRTYDVQPSLAWQATPELSLGIGVNVEYLDATLSNYLPSPLSPLYPDGRQELKGNGWNVGYSIGGQYHTEKASIGLSYKSAVKHKLKGDLNISGLADPITIGAGVNTSVANAQAEFTTPWQAIFGARYHVTPKLTIQGQVVRFGWSEFDTIELTKIGHLPDQSMPFDYKDTTSVSIGADYAISDRLTIRGGVQSDQSPIQEGKRDPRVPDNDRISYATGLTYNVRENFAIDASLVYTKIDDSVVTKNSAAYVGTPLQTVILTNGKLTDGSAIGFGLGATFKF